MAEQLELGDFVREAILSVLGGISAAQESTDLGPHIAPSSLANMTFDPQSGVTAGARFLTTTIKFDVQVVASSTSTADAKAGLKFHVFTAGGGVSGTDKSEVTQRLQFAVPITFPGPKPSGASARAR